MLERRYVRNSVSAWDRLLFGGGVYREMNIIHTHLVVDASPTMCVALYWLGKCVGGFKGTLVV